MVDQSDDYILNVINENKSKFYEYKKKKVEKFRDRRIKAINKLSKMKGWSFGDSNPYFDDVFNILPNTKATNSKEYKKERRKYEEDVIRNATTY